MVVTSDGRSSASGALLDAMRLAIIETREPFKQVRSRQQGRRERRGSVVSWRLIVGKGCDDPDSEVRRVGVECGEFAVGHVCCSSAK